MFLDITKFVGSSAELVHGTLYYFKHDFTYGKRTANYNCKYINITNFFPLHLNVLETT